MFFFAVDFGREVARRHETSNFESDLFLTLIIHLGTNNVNKNKSEIEVRLGVTHVLPPDGKHKLPENQLLVNKHPQKIMMWSRNVVFYP